MVLTCPQAVQHAVLTAALATMATVSPCSSPASSADVLQTRTTPSVAPVSHIPGVTSSGTPRATNTASVSPDLGRPALTGILLTGTSAPSSGCNWTPSLQSKVKRSYLIGPPLAHALSTARYALCLVISPSSRSLISPASDPAGVASVLFSLPLVSPSSNALRAAVPLSSPAHTETFEVCTL